MSNFQAIATVTAALRQRLLEVAQVDVAGAQVTTVRPADVGGGMPQTGVNLFLFAAHVNTAHRNRDLPLRRSTGETTRLPMVPLDLDYLVSFYGDTNGAAQQLLGSVMTSLYARPTLTPDMITAVEGGAGGLNSGLAEQPERVHLTPLPMPVEEMSKLWSVFFQTSYALSIAFRASPVFLEASLPSVVAPPVITPQLTTVVLSHPLVTAITAAGPNPAAPIIAGSTIVITGQRLAGPAVGVEVAGIDVVPASVTTQRITLTLPPTLSAGPTGVRVRQDVLVGTPPTPRPGGASGLASFVLHPAVTHTGGNPDIKLTNVTGAGAQPRNGTISIGLAPPVQAAQTATLDLLDMTGVVEQVVNAISRDTPTQTVSFQFSGIPAGTHALRVRIDGAETLLTTDTTPGSPTLGQLIPQLVLP